MAVAALVVAGAVRLAPAMSLALALAVPAAEGWLARLLSDPATDELTLDVDGQPVVATRYRPPSPRGALVLVHGLSPAGRRHPELVRLARLLARHGCLVLVPDLESLKAFRLTGREVTEIRAALRVLSAEHAAVGVAGFSFGAGPALLAARDVPGLTLAASFGGYASLRDVMVFLTTGVHEFGGRRYEQRPEPYNRWKLLALLVGFVEHERDRRTLDRIATRKLANPHDDTGALGANLGPEGRAIVAFVENDRLDAIGPLLAALPAGARAAMDRLSPLDVVRQLPGRLLFAHGITDASIPFTESLRLAEASHGRTRAVLLETFEHVGPQAAWSWSSVRARLADAIRLVRLTDAILSAP